MNPGRKRMNTLPAVHTPMVSGGTAHGTLATMLGGAVTEAFKDACNRPRKPFREGIYRSVLKKRIGRVDADEFMQLAHRFISICREEYGICRIECYKNWVDGADTKESSPHKLVDLDGQTPETFRELFAVSRGMKLCVLPESKHDDNQYSFTCMEWDSNRSRAIEFYAQTGGISHQHGTPLCDRLLESMFPKRYPTWNWVAKTGVMAVLRERYGW